MRHVAVGVQPRVQVLEAAAVAADDDQVHAPLVLDLEVAHGAAGVVRIVKRSVRRAAARQRGRDASDEASGRRR